MTNLTRRTALVVCPACSGMGGFERGEAAFDTCDICAGEGKVHARTCTAPLLVGGICGERLFCTWYRHDQPMRTGWGCINGHRWERTMRDGGSVWSRAEDRVSTVEVVA